MTDDDAKTREAFHAAVNMTPAALRRWLETSESQAVGMVQGVGLKADGAEGESVGHHMGHRILEIKERRQAELTEADYADMRKVAGYAYELGARPAEIGLTAKIRLAILSRRREVAE